MVRQLIKFIPRLEGALAFRRFCTPRLSHYRSDDHDVLSQRARYFVREALAERMVTTVGEIQTYVFEPREGAPRASVMLVHGWTGEASFMTAFSEYLRRRGFRAILLDMPAHGLSDGPHASLIDCAHAVREVAEAYGPIDFALGHSMGGLAVLLAGVGGTPLPKPYPFEAYVLVAVPNLFSDITDTFSRDRNLSHAGKRDFERRLENIAQRKLSAFTGAKLLQEAGQPALLIHAPDDLDVPFTDAEEIERTYEKAQLLSFNGLGHRNILHTPDVVRAATRYLESQCVLRTSDPNR